MARIEREARRETVTATCWFCRARFQNPTDDDLLFHLVLNHPLELCVRLFRPEVIARKIAGGSGMLGARMGEAIKKAFEKGKA